MKKIYIAIAIIFSACHSQTSTTTGVTTPSQKATSPSGPVDTFVWVGVHARWNYNQGVEYDGNYDTVHEVFVICSSDKHAKVPRNQVVLESSSSCDTAFSSRVRIMLYQRDNHLLKTIGNASSAGVTSTGSPTLSFTTQQGSRTIPLKQAEAVRIKQTFYLRNRILIPPGH